MRWSDQPGHKVEVPRHFLETLAEQMADPEKWAYMLREHARTVRKQEDLNCLLPNPQVLSPSRKYVRRVTWLNAPQHVSIHLGWQRFKKHFRVDIASHRDNESLLGEVLIVPKHFIGEFTQGPFRKYDGYAHRMSECNSMAKWNRHCVFDQINIKVRI